MAEFQTGEYNTVKLLRQLSGWKSLCPAEGNGLAINDGTVASVWTHCRQESEVYNKTSPTSCSSSQGQDILRT